MPTEPGQMLSHYRLIDKIGQGGMGVVWKAVDTTLDREVAIKILPEAFTEDPERLARFEREAKLLASLNHSNIAAIHGLEEADGVRFLTMELIPGQTLAEMIGTRPLPMDEALDLCRQIAEGLEAAHNSGVIHRDLKPGNVKVTPDGKAKVLDFGLAKGPVGTATGSDPDLSHSPTATTPLTHDGMVFGTAQYMSPEQARGKLVDKRTDIWSFGCLVYECLTGRQAFRGETVTDVLSAILRAEPEWTHLPERTPPRVRDLLERCLEKTPRNRLHDIGDARIELERALAGREWTSTGGQVTGTATPGRSRWWPTILVGVTALLVGIASALLILRSMSAPTPKPTSMVTTRSLLALTADAPLALYSASLWGIAQRSVAMSPDGARLVYAADIGETTQLFVRPLDRFSATPIPGTEGGINPFFSPDGDWVAFFTHDKLKKVALAGGKPVTLCGSGGLSVGTWSDDGMIYFSGNAMPVTRVPSEGGDAEVVLDAEEKVIFLDVLQSLPSGNGILLNSPGGDYARIIHFSTKTGKVKTVLEGGYGGNYAAAGYLVFLRGGDIHAAPFDLERQEVTGSPVSLVEGIWTDSLWGWPQFSFSNTGSLVYAAGGDWSRTIPTWMDRDGSEEGLPLPAQIYGTFKRAPDGKRLAIQVKEGPRSQIHIYDPERNTFSRLTIEGSNWYPIWTTDGSEVIFASDRDADRGSRLYRQSADGGSPAQPVLPESMQPSPMNSPAPYSVSSDGSLLWISATAEATYHDIWIIPMDQEEEPHPFLATSAYEWGPTLSPDSRWLAFTSDKTGPYEVFVRPYPENDREWQISDGGGEEPIWSPRGDELFYRKGDRLMVVEVTLGPEFRAGPPRVLLRAQFHNSSGTSYDVSPDGQRLLVNKPVVPETPVTQLRLVANWFEELKRKTEAAQ